ncbi:hypothetical protein PF005_g1218 [Phytophthora fragariae]|uniref:DDE Tnp4 domain-containing protein n=1 Tax=Phytophthora fragariae TaxID=53985 RepID=A0A6A4E2W7_9STRA|nr:hypothetical protein PF009_g8933 [Phytophthora fragariae]KAE9021496.1 hypothetical protein PF011_g4925 [Phytophthora fragariae]KAE9120643.1 hypothetical protein PF010_g7413 [Phytophthora fragariae]KAE9236011.1 hypothetical protein PF005_g1218 [Phytophthora fragariae]KAE9241334.1 hypothetical protein PF002_g9317 [Phytophthora fragariae]
MLQSSAYSSWFETNLRCTRSTFFRIASFLQEHGVAFAQTKVKKHSYEKKVAAVLYFLGSVGGYREVGAAMSMARSYVMEITTEVVRVLNAVAPAVISFPRSRDGWTAVEDGFASPHGYPGVADAIDGSLIAIERPEDYDGFYCRKCYPALNVQAIVSPDRTFKSVEVRSGSWSDRKCWKYSRIGRPEHSVIPAGMHFISDAGYAQLHDLIVPYCEREEGGELTPQQKQFNFRHSSTRVVVESTFGLWKGRFRMLQGVLNQETPRTAAKFVVATMVLHNVMIFFQDSSKIRLYMAQDDEEEAAEDEIIPRHLRQFGKAKRNAIATLICH